MRTFIRWPGNKLVYSNKIISFFPRNINGTYYEPFLGSGAIFLRLQPKRWVINDLNTDLYSVWKYIHTDIDKFIRTIKHFRKGFQESSDKGIDALKKFAKTQINNLNRGVNNNYSIRRAVTYVMMKYIAYLGHIFVKDKFAFVGLENNILKGNSLYYMGEKYLDNLRSVSDFMTLRSSGSITNTDYKAVISKAKKGDFVFLDPPYYEPEVNYQFNYNKNENLGNHFIKELKTEVDKLNKRGVKWLMTQADTPFIKETFKSYTISQLRVYRRTKRTYVNELIIQNY